MSVDVVREERAPQQTSSRERNKKRIGRGANKHEGLTTAALGFYRPWVVPHLLDERLIQDPIILRP